MYYIELIIFVFQNKLIQQLLHY